VQAANRLSPDVVVLTGDLVSHSASYSVACARELTALRSRYGIYAVLGNHDIWTGADEVARNLRGAGITVLRDEKQSLLIDEGRLWLVGIEDAGFTAMLGSSCEEFRRLWAEKHTTAISLLRSIPEAESRILLVHHPDFNELLAGERIDLALSGHTHGGQVRLPFLGSPFVPSCLGQKYAGGLVQGPASPVYVNRGIGVTAPPARFGCRPEITLLRLRRG
jgi:predicted MPP superfamily phosphohydrolase